LSLSWYLSKRPEKTKVIPLNLSDSVVGTIFYGVDLFDAFETTFEALDVYLLYLVFFLLATLSTFKFSNNF